MYLYRMEYKKLIKNGRQLVNKNRKAKNNKQVLT